MTRRYMRAQYPLPHAPPPPRLASQSCQALTCFALRLEVKERRLHKEDARGRHGTFRCRPVCTCSPRRPRQRIMTAHSCWTLGTPLQRYGMVRRNAVGVLTSVPVRRIFFGRGLCSCDRLPSQPVALLCGVPQVQQCRSAAAACGPHVRVCTRHEEKRPRVRAVLPLTF